VIEDIVDRLESVNRGFPLAAFDGAGEFVAQLTPACGVGVVLNLDTAPARLPGEGLRIAADLDALPVKPGSLNLFVSMLTLHTVNDLIGALTQARMALRPDGLFIAAIFGEETLSSLRHALYSAESELTGGVSARIAPFAGVRDYGAALQRAGFALPVADIDKITVRYDEPLKLLSDLRGMGETRALKTKAAPLRRDVLLAALTRFAESGDVEHFDIVYLTGWAPHESQQKPLAPGSGITPLKDAVKGAS
jgi:SAM-dependent methyltransferase